jgi:hypothetical protein
MLVVLGPVVGDDVAAVDRHGRHGGERRGRQGDRAGGADGQITGRGRHEGRGRGVVDRRLGMGKRSGERERRHGGGDPNVFHKATPLGDTRRTLTQAAQTDHSFGRENVSFMSTLLHLAARGKLSLERDSLQGKRVSPGSAP